MSVKAFNMQLILGRENIMGNKPKVLIECFDISGKNLYIGTNDCCIYHFLLLEDVDDDSTLKNSGQGQGLNAFLQNQKKLGFKKSITKIIACNEIKKLLVLCDNALYVYSVMDLSISPTLSNKIKNVSGVFLNSNPVHASPFSNEICVTFLKKKSLQLYQIAEDNLLLLRDVSFSDSISSLAIDGRFMCIASSLTYSILEIDTSNKLPLFPVTETPMVQKIAASEFLLTGPNSLGVFVTTGGISQRPPIQWSESVFQSTYVHPYVIAIDDEFVTIHSIVDQQQKQTIPFQGGIQLLKYNKKVLVCTRKDVFAMTMIPYEMQISSLLKNKMVEEAMNLSKACRKSMSHHDYQQMMNTVYRRSGFVYFQNMEFDAAEEMFKKGKLDARELISLFPNILPKSSNFVKSTNLHDIANVNEMCNNNKKNVDECLNFLCNYLEINIVPALILNTLKTEINGHSTDSYNAYRNDLFMSCITVFAFRHETMSTLKLIGVLSESSIHGEIALTEKMFDEFQSHWNVVVKILHGHKCYHAEAVCLLVERKFNGAFDIWKQICRKELSDHDFPGIEFVAKNLAQHCFDVKLLWLHAEWILDIDQDVGTEIFTTYLPQSQKLHEDIFKSTQRKKPLTVNPDEVIDFLHHYQHSVIRYLEHLVYVENMEKEKYHTHLVVLYLENILQFLDNETDNEKLQRIRKKFQEILQHSNLYRITLILSKIKETELYTEQVILHGKLGEHKQALDILVNLQKDQKLAEEYCMEQAVDEEHRKKLFGILLSVYLSKISEASSRGSSSVTSAISILNKYAENYDAMEVLQMLPNKWSIGVLEQFLTRTLRLPMHAAKTKQIENMLAKAENMQVHGNKVKAQSKSVLLTEDKVCMVCNRVFQNSDCVFFPNGVTVHPQCGTNKYVCPVSGTMFYCQIPNNKKS